LKQLNIQIYFFLRPLSENLLVCEFLWQQFAAFKIKIIQVEMLYSS